jgi:hypothetical protein
MCGQRLSAQIVTGSIGGTVTDATGAILPGVKVTTSSPALIGGARTVVSDSNGNYKFLELPPGTYEVRFEKQGFQSLVQQNIVINTGVEITANGKLALGDVTQTVMVEAQAATIDIEHVTASVVASQAVMEDIPNGRSPWAIANSVAATAPSTFDVGGSSGMQQASLIAHGSTTADQKFMIDGISVNWPGGAGGSTLMYYDMGMFQEVNYLIGAVPADVSQGGVYMNMITKDGGNRFHGRVFANGASEGMQSKNINSTLANELLNNLSATTKSLINVSTVIPGTPITETYDYNGQFGGPIIKDKLWFFTSWRIWATNNIVSGAFNANGTQALNPNQIADEMGKFSYQATPKNRFSLMYFRNQKNRYDRRNQGNFGDNVTTVLQNQPGYEADLKWIYVPTPRLVIDAGFALTAGKTPYRYQPDAPVGAISVYDSLTTQVYNIAQYYYINPVYRGALDASASYFASWAGSHNIKFGVQAYRDGFSQRYTANGDLQGVLNNGIPAQATLYNTPIDIQKNNVETLGLYAEDTWKIKRLTVNYGLRWERWDGTIPAQSSPAGTFVGARSYAFIQGPDWKNFTPRFGFAYDLTGKGKTVLKGSVSKYMQGEGAGNVLTAINPLALSTETVTWTCPPAAGNAACIANGPTMSQLNLSTANGFTGGLTTKLGPGLQRPRSWEYNLGIQQELPLGVIFSVMGWYRKTTDQIGTENTAVPSSAYTPYILNNPLTGGKFTFYDENAAYKGLQSSLLVNSPVGDIYYRGIDFTFSRRMTRRWMMVGGLTYGRFSGAWTGDINTSLLDLNNPNYNLNRNGALGNDAPVIFKLGGTYNLPRGVVLAGNFQHVTGYPVEATYAVTSAILDAQYPGAALTQSTQTVYMAPSGSYRLPNVNLMDIRLSRIFTIKERFKLEPEFDIYNLLNVGAVISENGSITAGAASNGTGSVGSLFLNPTNVLPPRLFKIGLRFDF